VTHANCEVVCVVNDQEQAQSRVFAPAVDLCRNNPELSGSVLKTTQSEIRFSNNSVIKAIASDYKGLRAGANA